MSLSRFRFVYATIHCSVWPFSSYCYAISVTHFQLWPMNVWRRWRRVGWNAENAHHRLIKSIFDAWEISPHGTRYSLYTYIECWVHCSCWLVTNDYVDATCALRHNSIDCSSCVNNNRKKFQIKFHNFIFVIYWAEEFYGYIFDENDARIRTKFLSNYISCIGCVLIAGGIISFRKLSSRAILNFHNNNEC